MELFGLKIATVCMGIGFTCFLLLMRKAKLVDRPHFLALIFTAATATASSMAMALGQTHLRFPDGHAVYAARYLDWLITTPLLLLSMGYVADTNLRRAAVPLVAAIGADVFMIITGFAGAATSDDGKWAWFTLSCIAFVAVLGILWGGMRTAATSQARFRAFTTLAGLITMLWMQYPFVFALGEEGLRVIPSTVETVWFGVIDVLAKVAFGFISIAYMTTFTATDESERSGDIGKSKIVAGVGGDVFPLRG